MNRSRRGGLARRIYLAFLAAAVLPTAIAGAIGVAMSLERLQGATIDGLQRELSARGSGLRQVFDAVAGELRFLATNPQAVQLLAPSLPKTSPRYAELGAILSEQYERMARSQRDVYQLRLLDRFGQERIRVDRRDDRVLVAGPAELQDKSDRYYFQEAISRAPGRLYVSPLDLNVEHGQVETPERPVVRLATAVIGADGQTLGIVIVNLHARVLIEPVQQMVQAREGVAYLFDRSSHFLARSADDSGRFSMLPLSELGALDAASLHSVLTRPVGYLLKDGKIWAHAPVEFPAGALSAGAPRWVMAIAFPEQALLREVLALSRLYAVLLVALVVAAGAGYWLSRRLIGPLEALAAEADAVAQGDFARRVRVEGHDEIAWLGERFNAMATRLQATLAELQAHGAHLAAEVQARTADLAAERARLAAVLRHTSDAIAAVCADGDLLFANDAAQRLLSSAGDANLSVRAALAAWVGDREPGRAEVRLGPHLLSVSRDLLPTATPADDRTGDMVVVVRDLLPTATPADDRTGDMVVVVRDVTEERLLSDERREFDRQLAQTDKLATLGELAMGVAHEIGNPLAGMKAVVQTLLLEPGLGAEPQEDLQRLEGEIDRLADFLRRFRGLATPRPPSISPQPLEPAVQDMLFWVRKQARGQQVVLTCSLPDDLPPLRADPTQLRQLLLNLMVNALHAMPQGGHLTITGDLVDDGVSIDVQDTGHGVATADLPHLFEPLFTTRRDGSGLGLAICAKIVDDHHGRITVRSRPGETHFNVVWPAFTPD